MEKLRVLYIADEEDNIKSLEICCGDDWKITSVLHPKQIMDGEVDPNQFDLVIADLVFNVVDGKQLPPDPEDGRKLVTWLALNKPGVPVMVLSGWTELTLTKALQKRHPKLIFVEKPIDLTSRKFHEQVQRLVGARGGPS